MSNAVVALGLVSAVAVPGCAADEGNATLEVGVASVSSGLTAADASAQAPVSGIHVRVTVKEIRVHVAGSDGASGVKPEKGADKALAAPNEDLDGDGKSGGAGWITVFRGERSLDLDGLAVPTILGSVQVPAGKITQVRLILDGQARLVEGTNESPLACGSCDTSGLKILPKGDARLVGGTRHNYVLALDLDKSIVDEGGERRLKPVLRLTDGS